MKEILIRLTSPSPSIFKKIQKIGLALAAVGTVIVAAPVALPASIVGIGGYLITAGAIAAAIAKVTVEDDSVLPK